MSEHVEALLEKEQLCNGCQSLNFRGKTCRNPQNAVRENKTTHERILSTFTNGEGYISVVRPQSCKSYKPHEKKAKTLSISKGEE